MNLISMLFKSRAPTNRTAGSAYNFFMGPSAAGKRVNERTAMQTSAVYACVRVISESVASLPLHLYRYTDNGRYFALMHYPMLSWPKKNSGSIQLHGHIHARMDYNEQNRNEGVLRYDVGVDANNFYPVSVKQIIEFFEMSR